VRTSNLSQCCITVWVPLYMYSIYFRIACREAIDVHNNFPPVFYSTACKWWYWLFLLSGIICSLLSSKTFQNGCLCLECGRSEQSLCPSHKELKSEWRSTSAPTQNPTTMPYLMCVHTWVSRVRKFYMQLTSSWRPSNFVKLIFQRRTYWLQTNSDEWELAVQQLHPALGTS
jgi:hypothetical protein